MCCFLPQISEAVLVTGEELSRRLRMQNHSPLMYEWYGEQYIGAAHGLAGIYYYLMQVYCGGFMLWRQLLPTVLLTFYYIKPVIY